jgi:hypothetical protein
MQALRVSLLRAALRNRLPVRICARGVGSPGPGIYRGADVGARGRSINARAGAGRKGNLSQSGPGQQGQNAGEGENYLDFHVIAPPQN